MLTLAFDTCLECCSAAVGDGEGRVLAALDEPMQTGHGERLIPMLGEVLQDAGGGFRDVARIVVTCGPGSFTGVRIGIAAARGLALALEVPVSTATSLELIAASAGSPDPAQGLHISAAAVGTRDGMMYVQAFEAQCSILGPAVLTATAAADAIGTRGAARPLRLLGTGALALAEACRLRGSVVAQIRTDVLPSARHLMAIADRLPTVSPVSPLYLREPDAKPQPLRSTSP